MVLLCTVAATIKWQPHARSPALVCMRSINDLKFPREQHLCDGILDVEVRMGL